MYQQRLNNTSSSSRRRGVNTHSSCRLSSGSLIFVIASVLLLQTISVYCAFPASNIVVIGGGGTFAEEVHKGCGQNFFIKHFTNNIEMNYNATGSGTGLLNLVNYTSTPFDYAAGELIPSTSQYTDNPGLQLIPFIGVNVLVVFNLPGITSLTLSRQLVVDIFAARVTKWNDASIAALNPSVTLPDATIKRVVRSDSSGTTELFTSALSAFANSTGVTWTPGSASSITWPSETSSNISKQKGTSGVSNYVYQTAYTIAYNTPSAVFTFTSATIVNKYGTSVVASETSCANAMTDFQDAFDSRFSAAIVDAPGQNSYPISGYSYIIYKSTSIEDCNLAKVLYRYFTYLYSGDIDSIITTANFVPLPNTVKAKVQAKLDNWVCSSKETAVTSEVEVVAIVLLSIAGGIVSVLSLGIVFGVSIYAQWKKKKEDEESSETD